MESVYLTILSIFGLMLCAQAQTLPPSPCYSVATNNGAENALFEYDPSNYLWNEIGITGTNFIEAIAIDITTGIIYAAEGAGGAYGTNGAFGTINLLTGAFT